MPEGTLANWSTGLTLTYKQRKEIPEQHKKLAICKSRDGFDFMPRRPWEKGAYPQEPLEDWGEDDELFSLPFTTGRSLMQPGRPPIPTGRKRALGKLKEDRTPPGESYELVQMVKEACADLPI